jgi:murein L,D-transpeptidase YafK
VPNPALKRDGAKARRPLASRNTRNDGTLKTIIRLRYLLPILLVLWSSALAVQDLQADKILVEKKARRLTLFSKGQVIKTYKVVVGGNTIGPKEREGDNKTPEGTYTIDSRNKNSRYHL